METECKGVFPVSIISQEKLMWRGVHSMFLEMILFLINTNDQAGNAFFYFIC